MLSQWAALLTQSQVETIHEASLEILEQVGLLARNTRAREILARHGCHVDRETQIVRFPRPVVERYRAAFPAHFTFYGRDPKYDRTIPGAGPLNMTARRITVDGTEIRAQRLSYAGELSWKLYVRNELAVGLWDTLMAAGAAYGIQSVGRVRSGGFGYTVGQNIALCYLPRPLTKPGTRLSVAIFSRQYEAYVAEDALFDPAGRRMRS